jgi:hypothetical protein
LHPDAGYYGDRITYQRLSLAGLLDLRGIPNTQFFLLDQRSLGNATMRIFRVLMSKDAGLNVVRIAGGQPKLRLDSELVGIGEMQYDGLHWQSGTRTVQLSGYRYQPEMKSALGQYRHWRPRALRADTGRPCAQRDVNVFQPELVVTNAFDPQNDTLTYQFEVLQQ